VSESVRIVRSDGGDLFETFEMEKIIAICWKELGELSVLKTREAIRDRYERAYSDL
jgi:predicted Mrr-cat superfamily restriction endonuclease